MNVVREILKVLAQMRGHLIPQPTLLAQIRIAAVPPPTSAEVLTGLQHCENEGWAVSIRPELGGHVKWRITDSGMAVLAADQ